MPFIFVFGLRQQTQFLVPLPFQSIGDQAIIRIDSHIAQPSLIGFILSALHLLLAELISFRHADLDFALHI